MTRTLVPEGHGRPLPEPTGMVVESVWDYPRPPRCERREIKVRVEHCGHVLAESDYSLWVMETSHPPTIYLPPKAVRCERLQANPKRTWCEFKGQAVYWDLADPKVPLIAWSYPDPNSEYEVLRDHLAFYASKLEACYLGGERVTAQPGDFYGGWITSRVSGPFKGDPGTMHW